MSNIISGRELSKEIRSHLKLEVERINNEYNLRPKLVVILVGENPASISYVKAKEKACIEVGILNETIRMEDTISEEELLSKINELNNDSSVNGILVQLPLPKHISEQKVIETIDELKDVDGFKPSAIGHIMQGQKALVPCTPKGIITMLKSVNVDLNGKHAVVVGRSNIVGKPVAQLLLNENATVTICHSRTKDLGMFTRSADVLVAAVGRPKMITANMVKDGAVVIDVGVNRVDGKLVGDVDFENIKDKAAYITPVPGGVGPMTITSLIENTFEATLIQKGIE